MIHHREACETAWRIYRQQAARLGYFVESVYRGAFESGWHRGFRA